MSAVIRSIRDDQLFDRATATRRATEPGASPDTARRIAAANCSLSPATATMSSWSALNRRISARSLATTGTPMARYSFSLVG
jgi:hypothetical protein